MLLEKVSKEYVFEIIDEVADVIQLGLYSPETLECLELCVNGRVMSFDLVDEYWHEEPDEITYISYNYTAVIDGESLFDIDLFAYNSSLVIQNCELDYYQIELEYS